MSNNIEIKIKRLKIFITGGAGFIGSNLVEELVKNNFITIYDNFSSGKKEFLKTWLRSKNLKIIKGDLLDFKKLKRAIKGHELVIHLASNPDIAKGILDPSIDLKQGILVTFNVINAMRLNNIKKLIYLSGSGVYGDQNEKVIKENFGPLIPVSMYGASKLSAEALICAFCHLYDMQAWIFRPANIVGKNQTHGVAHDFIKKLRKNPKKLLILGDGKQSKSYLHVKDLIRAVLKAFCQTNKKVNIFNVASEDFLTVNEIAKIVIEEMGLKNVKLKYTGGKVGWKGDVPKVRLDISSIKKIGWRPKFNSKEAVRQAVRELLCK